MNDANNGNGNRLAKDTLARLLGMQIQEMRPGYARVTMEVRPDLLNGLGFTHGGAIFSLADVAFAAAGNADAAAPPAVALNTHITFLKSTAVGDVLTATAVEENSSRRFGSYRMEVKNRAGELIAVAQGLGYRIKS